MKYNFDKKINRRHTSSLKWDVAENELPMWVADMDFETAPVVKEVIKNRANIGAYGYSVIPNEFFESISNWWDRRHHIKFATEWMIFATGVVASISSMVRKLTTIGENVLVISPVYNIFYNSIYNNGRNVVCCPLDYDEKNATYSLNMEKLESYLANPQTSMLIFCNPHNPVGHIWTKEELIKIGELCNKHHVIVISDEIHCDICEEGYEYVPFASVSDINKEISITCVSASKTFNMAGLQSSCVIVPNEFLRHKVWRALNTDEVAEPNFFAVDANIAAFTKGEGWVNELNKYIGNNRKYLTEYIKTNLPHLKVIEAHATYLMWVDASFYEKSSTKLDKFIRDTSGLYVSDGMAYFYEGQETCFLRINLATPLDNIKDGAKRLKYSLDKFAENK